MEHVKVFLTKENIDYIKSKGSFAQIVNLLIQEMRNNKSLEVKITGKYLI